GTALLTLVDTMGVQVTTDDLVTNTRKVLHTTTADKHHGVLLPVVARSWDVCGNLDTGGQAHTSNLTQSGVRLLRRGGVHVGANATTLRGTLQRSGSNLRARSIAALADQLLNSWHYQSFLLVEITCLSLYKSRPLDALRRETGA